MALSPLMLEELEKCSQFLKSSQGRRCVHQVRRHKRLRAAADRDARYREKARSTHFRGDYIEDMHASCAYESLLLDSGARPTGPGYFKIGAPGAPGEFVDPVGKVVTRPAHRMGGRLVEPSMPDNGPTAPGIWMAVGKGRTPGADPRPYNAPNVQIGPEDGWRSDRQNRQRPADRYADTRTTNRGNPLPRKKR